MKCHALFALLFLLSSVAYASQLNVQVTVTQGTLAVGTNVSLVTGGVELESKKADNSGVASFNVSDGSYFVLLRRYPYPLHVSLAEVSGNTNVSLSMRQLISYASSYGQITGPASFANSSVAAYSGNEVAKRVYPNKDGYYVLSFVPEGNYQFSFSAPGFQEKRVDAFLPTADFVQLDAKLEPASQPQAQQPEFAVPQFAEQFSAIEIVLTQGGLALANQAVWADTPSGRLQIFTDSLGKARLNAPSEGTYVFTWGNYTYSTLVAGKPLPSKPNATQIPTALPPAQPQQPPATHASSGEGTLAAVVVAIAAGAIVLIAAIMLAVRHFSKPGHKHAGHSHPGHAHEGGAAHARHGHGVKGQHQQKHKK